MTSGDTCPVTWQGETDQMGRTTTHTCVLPADHVHDVLELRREASGLTPYPAPHTCHCGAWVPVRDVEPIADRDALERAADRIERSK